MVPKQPPPNFQAPTPEISPLNRLFMIVQVYGHLIQLRLKYKFKHLPGDKCYINLK